VSWLRGVTYAHRGLHGAGRIENSPSAFRAAIEAGLGIECDIQRSLDDYPMVFHDWDLSRLLARPDACESLTASELKSLRYANGDAPITLTELLEQIAGRVPVLIEIKSREGYDVEWSCRFVADALTGYRGHHAVMSFDPRVSQWFGRHAPETVRGLVVTEAYDRDLPGDLRRRIALWRARPDFLACDVRDLPSRFAAAQRAKGLPVLTWTVSDAARLATARAFADSPIAEGEGLELALRSP
jgi:glycerophosphoryl diester phosphodiesterase